MKLTNSSPVLKKMKKSTRKYLRASNRKKNNIFNNIVNFILLLKKLTQMTKSFNWSTELKFKGFFNNKETTVKKSGKDRSKMNLIHFHQLLIKNLQELLIKKEKEKLLNCKNLNNLTMHLILENRLKNVLKSMKNKKMRFQFKMNKIKWIFKIHQIHLKNH